jgi:hypothetical protein
MFVRSSQTRLCSVGVIVRKLFAIEVSSNYGSFSSRIGKKETLNGEP